MDHLLSKELALPIRQWLKLKSFKFFSLLFSFERPGPLLQRFCVL